MNKKRIVAIIIILLLAASRVFAATVTLNSGKVIDGEIIERTGDYIQIDTGLGIPLTYYLDEIASIVEGTAKGADEVEWPAQPAEESPDGEPAAGLTEEEPIEPAVVEEPTEPIVTGEPEMVPVIATERRPVETVVLEPVAIMTDTRPAEKPATQQVSVQGGGPKVGEPAPASSGQIVTAGQPAAVPPAALIEELATVAMPLRPVTQQPEDSTASNVIKLPVEIVEPEVTPRKDIATLDGVSVFKPQTTTPVARKPGEARPYSESVEPESVKQDEPTTVSLIEKEIAQANAVDEVVKPDYGKDFLAKLDALREAFAGKLNEVKEQVRQKWPDVKDRLDNIPVEIRRAILVVALSFFGSVYFLFCLPLMFIARKLGHKHIWLIWVPVIQVFYYIRMAGRRVWAVLLLLLPVFHIFVPFFWFADILKRLGKPRWLVLFMLLPGVNVFTLWYLVISRTNSPKTNSK